MLHRLILICLVVVACGVVGCTQQRRSSNAVEITLVFENVRLVRDADRSKPPVLDEWGRIKAILASHSARPPTERVLREKQPVGNTAIRDYESSILLGSFAAMDAVDADLQRLSGSGGDREDSRWWRAVKKLGDTGQHRSIPAGERIEFQLVGVDALYRSNYIATAIEVFIRGSTTPGATVTLYVGQGVSPEVVRADRRGYFSQKLPALPGDRYIYGESRLDNSPSKYFRIDVLTQQQDALTEEEFRRGIGTGKK